MKTVMAQGTFDVLHPGHLYYLRNSRELGDRLVVVISRDSRNDDRGLYFNEDERKEMVGALECVDEAVLGVEGDIYETVEKIDPDVITLGHDQGHSEKEVENMAEKATGKDVKVERIDNKDDYSSSDIKND